MSVDGEVLSQVIAAVDSNEDTIRASNSRMRQDTKNETPSVSSLFDTPSDVGSQQPPPPPPPMDGTSSRPPFMTEASRMHSFASGKSPFPPRPRRTNCKEREISWGDTPSVPREVFEEQNRNHHSRNISNIPLELLNPYETEAETNILRALQSCSPDFAKTSHKVPVLSQVPDERIHDFESEKKLDEGGSSSVGRRPSSNSLDGTLADLVDALSALDGETASSSQRQKQDEIHSKADSMKFAKDESLVSHPAEKEHAVGNDMNNVTSPAPDIELKPLLLRRATTVETAIHDLTNRLAPLHDLENQPDEPRIDTMAVVPDITHADRDGASSKQSTADEQPIEDGSCFQIKAPSRVHNPNYFIHERVSTCCAKWSSFLSMNRRHCIFYVKSAACYLVIPSVTAACVLYYFAGNPLSRSGASISWWLIFVCVRQVATLSLAAVTQSFIIDFLALGTQAVLRLLGPVITLVLVHSRGWPFIAFFWSLYNFGLLYNSRLAGHWMYWQSEIEVFSEANPDGAILEQQWYKRLLITTTITTTVVSLKRFAVGLFLGRQTFMHHGEHLANLLSKMLLVSQVAGIARRASLAKQASFRGLSFGDEDSDTRGSAGNTLGTQAPVIDMNARDPITGNLTHQEKMKLYQLLDQWEDPNSFHYEDTNKASISAVLNFRKALAFIQKRYPFSYAFGPAQTREECVESSQKLYDLLLKHSSGSPILHFETIARVAVDDDGRIDQTKAKALMKAFRPDRQGNLSMLDFVRSVDTIFKEYKFLNASIDNSSAIDRQIESVLNCFFYGCIAIVIVSQLGFDPLSLFLSLSSVILAFTFMIGNAASGYVDGIMFVVGRRPMSIGDGVCFSDVNTPLQADASAPYFIKSMTLLQTTAVFSSTNEVCSFSNGSLANCRVVNLARSPNPAFSIRLKLPINTSYDRVLILKSAVEEFIKARPREWLSINGFMAERIEISEGWIEYIVFVLAQGTWQDRGRALESKANLSSYCQEAIKQLGLNYSAPPLPVDIQHKKSSEEDSAESSQQDPETAALRFRSMALSAHNIRYN